MKKSLLSLCLNAALLFMLMPVVAFAQDVQQQVSERFTFEDSLSSGPVYLVPVDGMIDNSLARYIERASADAIEAEASLIIYHVDTFGGLVDAADKIRKTILDVPLPTLAYIDKNAASAGALISYSADRIVMAPGSSIGCCDGRSKAPPVPWPLRSIRVT